MKNLKKALALVLSCAMVFGMVVTAAVTNYPDVSKDATYAEAVNVLSALGAIQGDENGNFNPDSAVTRAEMAKLLYTMVSTGSVSNTATQFADVASEHWASGYIQYSKQLGFIDGYDAVTYGPEDSVTYEQVLKLVLCAMGYKNAAEYAGGFPTGYLLVAADIGLTKGIKVNSPSEPAPRSVVASVIYNGMNLPIMKQTKFGSEPEFKAMDGSDDANGVFLTLLNKTYGTYKVEGKVVATSKTALTGRSQEDKVGYIAFDVTNALKVDLADLDSSRDTVSVSDPYTMPSINAAGTGADALLGYESVAYLKSDDGEFALVAIVSKANRNIETKIINSTLVYNPSKDSAVKDADAFNLVGDDDLVYSYWNDRDEDTKITVKDVYSGDAAGKKVYVIWNGVVKGTLSTLLDSEKSPYILENNAYKFNTANVVCPKMGSVKLVDTDNDGNIDIISSTAYETALVTGVNASKQQIKLSTTYTTNRSALGNSLTLDTDENTELKEWTVVMDDGTAIDLEDIEINDVISVSTDNFTDPTFYDIIVTRKTATGTVNEAGTDEYTIEGSTYEIADGITSITLKVGSEGIFYLDMNGRIIGMDATNPVGDYAYLVKMGGNNYEELQMKMFTADGTKTFEVAEKIKINGKYLDDYAAKVYTKKDINDIFENSTEYTAFATGLTDEVTIADIMESGEYGGYVGTDKVTPAVLLHALTNNSYDGKVAPALNDNLTKALAGSAKANAFVSYKVTDNTLKEINLALKTDDDKYFNCVYAATGADQEWKEDYSSFGSTNIAVMDNAKVFMVKGDDASDYQVKDITALKDGKAYQPILFESVDDSVAAVLILNDGSGIDSESALAVFDSKIDALYNDDEVIAITAYQNGEKMEKKLIATSTTSVNGCGYQNASVDDLQFGDTFIYDEDSDGYVTEIKVVFSPGSTAPAFADTTDFTAGNEYMSLPDDNWAFISNGSDNDQDSQIFFGYLASVNERSNGSFTVKAFTGDGKKGNMVPFIVPSDVKVTVINPKYVSSAGKRIKPAETMGDAEVVESDYTELSNGSIDFANTDAEDMRYVFIRMYDETPIEVIYVNYF